MWNVRLTAKSLVQFDIVASPSGHEYVPPDGAKPHMDPMIRQVHHTCYLTQADAQRLPGSTISDTY